MGIRLKESDAEQAFAMLSALVGPDYGVYWEFQDAAEIVLFVVRGWPQGQDQAIEAVGNAIRLRFDEWFPPQMGNYTWMVTFVNAEHDCSGVLICDPVL